MLIDTVVLTMLSIAAHRLGASNRFVAVVDALYVIVMTWRWGRTVGKFVIEIRVIDASRRRPNWRQSIVRWAAVGWIGAVVLRAATRRILEANPARLFTVREGPAR